MKHLSKSDKEFILANQGRYTLREFAAMIGCCHATINKFKNRSGFKTKGKAKTKKVTRPEGYWVGFLKNKTA